MKPLQNNPWLDLIGKRPLTHAERGRLGGLKGGKARATNRTKLELSVIGQMGAAVRWGKDNNP